MYNKGQSVIVKNSNGKYLDGIILQLVDFNTDEMWWVQTTDGGRTDVNVYSSEDLDEWNKIPINLKCTCGSKTAGQSNRHSYYCDIK